MHRIVLSVVLGAAIWAHAQVKPGAQEPTFCRELLGHMEKFLPDSLNPLKLAVFPFANQTSNPPAPYGIWTAEKLIAIMKTKPRFLLTDRRVYKRELRNREYSPKDVIDDSTAQRICKEMDTPHMMVGTITNDGLDHKVEARIIDVSTGIIVTGAAVDCFEKDFDAIETDLLDKRASGRLQPAVVRSILPGYGQFYRKRWVAGTLFGVGFLASGALTGVTVKQMLDAKEDHEFYRDSIWENTPMTDSMQQLNYPRSHFEKGLEDRWDTRIEKRGIMASAIAITTGIWALNMIDVVISGRAMHRKYQLYYTLDANRTHTFVLACEF
ncbi:MAG: hypothetical protein GF398_11145 [Chitinivibrionales bacterium]|nr:hypothetical protein [Chitinivibrionales bacterium]